MCIALAAYQDRIASLFESSEMFIIIHSPSYDIKQSKSINVSNKLSIELIQLLITNNIEILICGAIRRCIRLQIEAQNIKVVPWITGNIPKVVQAFLSNNLFSSSDFLMPGCRRGGYQKRQRFRGR